MPSSQDSGDTNVVHLFPDFADTVIWFPHPVEYDGSGLSADLVVALQAWERFFGSHESARDHVVDAVSMPYYRDEGIRLARRLANEIGSRFVVEFDPDERHPSPRRFRAAGRATNPDAARVFAALAAEEEEFRGGDWTLHIGS